MAKERIITTDSVLNSSSQIQNADIAIVGAGLSPALDTAGLTIMAENGTTPVAKVDTTNARLRVGDATAPVARLDIKGGAGTVPPIRVETAALVGTPVDGALEYTSGSGFRTTTGTHRAKIGGPLGNNLVFAPNSTEGEGVYTVWATMVAAAVALKGPKTIWIDTPFGFAIPTGTSAFGPGTTLRGGFRKDPAGSVVVECSSGTVLTGVEAIHDIWFFGTNNIAPVITMSALPDGSLPIFYILGTAILGGAEFAPMLRFTDGGSIILKDRGAIATGVEPTVTIDNGKSLTVELFDASDLQQSTIVGAAGVGTTCLGITATSPAATYSTTHTSVSVVNAHGSFESQLNDLVFHTDPTGIVETNRVYTNWTNFVAAAFAIKTPKTLWMNWVGGVMEFYVPAGSWDFGPDTTLVGFENGNATGDMNQMWIANGTSFAGLVAIKNISPYVDRTDGLPLITLTQGQSFDFLGRSYPTSNLLNTPVINIASGASARINMRGETPLGQYAVALEASAVCAMTLFDNSLVATPSAIAGPASAQCYITNGSPALSSGGGLGSVATQTNFAGSFGVQDLVRNIVAINSAARAPARVVSTSNIASLSGLATTVDGVALNTAGMRVLLTAQTTATANGIWEVQSGAWTRPTDFFTWSEVSSCIVPVQMGTRYADTLWTCTTDPPISVGSTNLVIAQVGGRKSISLNVPNGILPITNPATAGTYESALKQNFACYDFPDGATKYAHWLFTLPLDYNGGVLSVVPIWVSATAGGAGLAVNWSIDGTCFTDSGAFDAAFGTAITPSDPYLGGYAAYDVVDNASANRIDTYPLTLAGTPSAGRLASIRIARLGAADTFTGVVRLISVRVQYTARGY